MKSTFEKMGGTYTDVYKRQNMMLKGLITIKDIEKQIKYPNAAKDAQGRLLCAAAVGVTPDICDRVDELVTVSYTHLAD